MKLLIVSDTHGKHRNLDVALAENPDADVLIHGGDLEGGESYLEAVFSREMHMVRGNNDFFSRVQREEEFELRGHKIFLCHGHEYLVSIGLERLLDEAAARHARIAIYGHTHKPYIGNHQGIWLVNPGSLTYPRQDGRVPSYIVANLEAGAEPEFVLKYIER